MPLEHRWPAKYWYARVQAYDRSRVISLRILIPDKPPVRGDMGDETFETSRLKAKLRLEELEAALSTVESRLEAEGVIESFKDRWNPAGAKRKGKGSALLLEDLADSWLESVGSRPRSLSNRHDQQVVSRIRKFVEFMKLRRPKCRYCHSVDSLDARAYLQEVARSGVAPKTHNDAAKMLRSAFRELQLNMGRKDNPFEGIRAMKGRSLRRMCFTVPQLKAIFEEAEGDEQFGGVVILGICSGMRLGDCCRLKWSEVDLNAGQVVVRCSKHENQDGEGGTATIPMFRLLKECMVKLKPSGLFVFPKLERMYAARPDSVAYYVNRLIDRAAERLKGTEHGFERKAQRKRGVRKASFLGFHAFRTTWITWAHLGGLSSELITRVTGHSGPAMFERHYLSPRDRELNRQIELAMQPLLGELEGQRSHEAFDASEQVRLAMNALREMTRQNWSQARDEALAVLAKIHSL